MSVVIDTSEQTNIDWSAKGEARIVQNVMNLIRTWRYEVAYNRIMGLNPRIADMPAPEAAALFTSDIYWLVETFEPRAVVEEVTVSGIDSDGNIIAKVVIDIVGE